MVCRLVLRRCAATYSFLRFYGEQNTNLVIPGDSGLPGHIEAPYCAIPRQRGARLSGAKAKVQRDRPHSGKGTMFLGHQARKVNKVNKVWKGQTESPQTTSLARPLTCGTVPLGRKLRAVLDRSTRFSSSPLPIWPGQRGGPPLCVVQLSSSEGGLCRHAYRVLPPPHSSFAQVTFITTHYSRMLSGW